MFAVSASIAFPIVLRGSKTSVLATRWDCIKEVDQVELAVRCYESCTLHGFESQRWRLLYQLYHEKEQR